MTESRDTVASGAENHGETPDSNQQDSAFHDSKPPVLLAWQMNASTGWGLYGLHLAIQLKRLGRRVYTSAQPDLTNVPKPLHALLPQADATMPEHHERVVVVNALGNNFAPPVEIDLPNPTYNVGLAVFEDTALLPEHLDNLKRFDRLLAPSSWCQSILAGYGIDSTVCHQGYDTSIFHPAPRLRPKIGEPGGDGRVLVFSGGKLEYRKGQDIAIAAFRLFRQTPEGANAVLVTAWNNPWPQTMEGIWNAGHVKGVPKVAHGLTQLTPWLAANGVPPEQHLDLGQLTQTDAAAAIRECDVAIFPNRCEGATNMVLSECLGMGVPSLFGEWCGQKDLTGGELWSCNGAKNPPAKMFRGTAEWMEADPEELLARLQAFVRTGEPFAGIAPATWEQAAVRFDELLTVPELALVDG